MKLKSERDCLCLDRETLVFGRKQATIPNITLRQFTLKANFNYTHNSIYTGSYSMFCQRRTRKIPFYFM